MLKAGDKFNILHEPKGEGIWAMSGPYVCEEVKEYYEAEGGNTERSFETFGVDPDELCFPRGV